MREELKLVFESILEGKFIVAYKTRCNLEFWIDCENFTHLIKCLDKIDISFDGETLESVESKLDKVRVSDSSMRVVGYGYDKAGHTLTNIALKLSRIKDLNLELSDSLKRGCDASYKTI